MERTATFFSNYSICICYEDEKEYTQGGIKYFALCQWAVPEFEMVLNSLKKYLKRIYIGFLLTFIHLIYPNANYIPHLSDISTHIRHIFKVRLLNICQYNTSWGEQSHTQVSL